uniref:Uncharacterized protein n=1 Tax=Castor canadensis TaxID=51338 RepID=A0A8C0XR96_CASCN
MCVRILINVLFSISIHIWLGRIYIKNKVTTCCFVLELKSLFEKSSNWCFHYLMIHLDKTLNKPFEARFSPLQFVAMLFPCM